MSSRRAPRRTTLARYVATELHAGGEQSAALGAGGGHSHLCLTDPAGRDAQARLDGVARGTGSGRAGSRGSLRNAIGKLFASATYGAAFGLLPIGYVVFAAILLYRVTCESGKFDLLKDSIGHITEDARLQALLIAFAFGAFIEGATGFGTPVAVAAAMLVGLGFVPFYAAAICLLANTAGVAFGAIGIPIATLAVTTGLPLEGLSAAVARICTPASLFTRGLVTWIHRIAAPSACAAAHHGWLPGSTVIAVTVSPSGAARSPLGGVRIAAAMCLALFAMSFVHFGAGHASHAWSSELLVHHAGIPLALFVLLQDYRFVLLDAFVRFLANALLAAVLTWLVIQAAFRLVLVERTAPEPLQEALLLIGVCLFLVFFAWLRNRVQSWLTRAVFRQSSLANLASRVKECPAFTDEEQYLDWAAGVMAAAVGAARVRRSRPGRSAGELGRGRGAHPAGARQLPGAPFWDAGRADSAIWAKTWMRWRRPPRKSPGEWNPCGGRR